VLLPVMNPLFLGVALTNSFNRYYDFTPLPLAALPGVGASYAALQPNLPQVAPTANSEVSRITIGGADKGLEVVTIPGEGTNTFGKYIRALTANPNMMLLGLTHNSYGYIIPEEEFNYIDPSGDSGFVLPFTGYEEYVSLGILTAPLLRDEAYNKLFDLPLTDPRNLPPTLTSCVTDPTGRACLVSHLVANVDYIQRSYADLCRVDIEAKVPDSKKPAVDAFCGMIDPQTPLYAPCMAAGAPEAVCDIFGHGEEKPGGT
jgi:hypothetical protein